MNQFERETGRPPRAAVVILAGGMGARMNAGHNKVYLTLGNRNLLDYSLQTVRRSPLVSQIVIVIREEDRTLVAPLLKPMSDGPPIRIALGGTTRHDSEWSGIQALGPEIEAGEIDVVAIHDGARPFLTPDLLDQILRLAADSGGAIPCLAVEDTLYGRDQQTIVDANDYAWAQTPQAFAASTLYVAHAAAHDAGFEGVDTAEVVERFTDQRISVISGDENNIKVTFGHDLTVAEEIANAWNDGQPVPHSPSHESRSLIAAARARLLVKDEQLGSDEDLTLLAAGRSSQAWSVANDGCEWVIRIPIPNSGRNQSYRSEAGITERLAARGHEVCRWTLAEIDGEECCYGRRLNGSPVTYGDSWNDDFGAALAAMLHDLHRLPATGFGPLQNADGDATGVSSTPTRGIIDRWFHAPIWPFDQTTFADHPLGSIDPDLAERIEPMAADIASASGEPYGVVHSDLHREHLLIDEGRLGGVLDFGDAFIGSTAWDFALLYWYYGNDNAKIVADAYPAGGDILRRGRLLAVAVGCYKLAKNPADPAVLDRLRATVDGRRA